MQPLKQTSCHSQFGQKPMIGHNSPMIIRGILLSLFAAGTLWADDSQRIRTTAEQQARQIASGQAGDIHIEADPVDSSNLPPCPRLEGYTPPNTRSIGRIHVGVRCLEGASWSILVPVRIAVFAEYVTTRRALIAGRAIQAGDLARQNGDIGKLPAGAVLAPEQAIGKVLRNSVGAGQPLRSNQLLAPLVVRQGQNVRVVSQGPGFAVKADGKAINNAASGDLVRVRMPSGKTVSGIAQNDGSILLSN